MKTILFLFAILMICKIGFAHSVQMDVICQIESNCNDKAVGKSGEIGRYQITQIVLKQFNQMTQPIFAPNSRIGISKERLFESDTNRMIADWYFNWLFDRCWTVKDTLIAWNWGIGNWRKWYFQGANFKKLPKTTQTYLEKYEKLVRRES